MSTELLPISALRHRHKTNSDYILNRNWTGDCEFLIVQDLIIRWSRIPVIKDYPYLFDYEYLLNGNFSNHGKGDLILTKDISMTSLLVVEVKFINLRATGSTASTSRTKNRKKVREQAEIYSDLARAMYPGADVTAVTVTNEEICMHSEALGWHRIY